MTFDTPPYFWTILFCVTLSAVLLGYPLLSLRRARRAASWPAVPARLLDAELVPLPGRASSGWGIGVRYTYEVDGRSYEGRRLAFGYVPGSGRASAEAIVQRLREARALQVRVDPRRPSRSTLSVGVPQSTWFVLAMGVTVAFFFAVLIGALLLEDGLVAAGIRPVVQGGAMLVLPLFAAMFYVAFRSNRATERSVAENLITG